MAERITDIGPPHFSKFLPPVIKDNYGKWKYHQILEPGVLVHVSETGAEIYSVRVASPRLIKLNRPLAVHLGLDPDLLESPEGAEILSGKTLPAGADPIAMAYAGHQFGHFVPQLGDGRAILLGEVIDKDGVIRHIEGGDSAVDPNTAVAVCTDLHKKQTAK